jgi:hypothetical protein
MSHSKRRPRSSRTSRRRTSLEVSGRRDLTGGRRGWINKAAGNLGAGRRHNILPAVGGILPATGYPSTTLLSTRGKNRTGLSRMRVPWDGGMAFCCKKKRAKGYLALPVRLSKEKLGKLVDISFWLYTRSWLHGGKEPSRNYTLLLGFSFLGPRSWARSPKEVPLMHFISY